MRKIEINELRSIMLNLLQEVDRYCKENNIQYFLDSGTLLGAIRHQGFIPWDDDMDICMPRPDYERFLAEVKQKRIANYIDIYQAEDGLFPYIKIVDTRTELIEYPDTLRLKLGAYIDVFPKDGIPDDKKKAERLCRRAKFYSYWYWFNRYSVKVWKEQGSVLKRIVAAMVSPFCEDKLFPLKKCVSLAKTYDYNSCHYMATIVAGGMHNCVPKDCFSYSIPVQFEGHDFPAPVGYDQYLRTLYSHINHGDYMTLPPEHQKILHSIEIYWKDGYGE